MPRKQQTNILFLFWFFSASPVRLCLFIRWHVRRTHVNMTLQWDGIMVFCRIEIDKVNINGKKTTANPVDAYDLSAITRSRTGFTHDGRHRVLKSDKPVRGNKITI